MCNTNKQIVPGTNKTKRIQIKFCVIYGLKGHIDYVQLPPLVQFL